MVVNPSLNFNEPGLEALRFIIEFEKSMVNEESKKNESPNPWKLPFKR